VITDEETFDILLPERAALLLSNKIAISKVIFMPVFRQINSCFGIWVPSPIWRSVENLNF
jgi:hypothetical protein